MGQHFKTNGNSMYGEWRLAVKTAVMLILFLAPFIIMLMLPTTNLWLFLGLWLIMGLGMAGVGVNIMHDANHGSFARNKPLNNIMRLAMNLLGSDAAIWRLQHNVLHHSFTNIHEADEDIMGPPILRFSPHDPRKKIHKFQFVYAWFLYGLMTLVQVIYSDYRRAKAYYAKGLISTKKEYVSRLMKISTGKVVYFGYILLLPMLLLPVSPWLVVAGFLLMHWVGGFLLSIIFQTAHIMPSSEFPLPDQKGEMENHWAVHQMLSTSNYAPQSRIFSWFIGGLNYQIEHHLFAHISHVHYPAISVIVAETAREFDIPYHSQPTFASALRSHGRMLYQLGR